jgi:hypothetical protein
MPRKLKVYVTSIGFFDLAIAVPSMKAALEAWGADSNLFHQNFAKEVHDADIVKSAMAHPGIVLKRPVGSTKPFAEPSELPEDLVSTKSDRHRLESPGQTKAKMESRRSMPRKPRPHTIAKSASGARSSVERKQCARPPSGNAPPQLRRPRHACMRLKPSMTAKRLNSRLPGPSLIGMSVPKPCGGRPRKGNSRLASRKRRRPDPKRCLSQSLLFAPDALKFFLQRLFSSPSSALLQRFSPSSS